MSHSEGKAEVHVTRPGNAFPFISASVPPHPHISQWCRFSIPERFPLKPFRQDRLNRLPLPPSIMATSKVASTSGSIPQAPILVERRNGGIDPFIKVQQLEKSLAFVQENHAMMLKSLHDEIAELKQKNKELLFELVTGMPALPKEIPVIEKGTSNEDKETIEALEKEIRKLRTALKEVSKTNSSLSVQLQELKREQYSKNSSSNRISNKTPSYSGRDDRHPVHSPSGPSPQMEDYSDTLRQIQRAANYRNGKRDERRNRNDDGKTDWTDGYSRNSNGYLCHHHHQLSKSPRQHQHQPRLPRLPLRNQQNYSHAQYEIQYQQRDSLPALKQPLVPDHRLDKPRKSRGPRPPPKIDQVTNG